MLTFEWTGSEFKITGQRDVDEGFSLSEIFDDTVLYITRYVNKDYLINAGCVCMASKLPDIPHNPTMFPKDDHTQFVMRTENGFKYRTWGAGKPFTSVDVPMGVCFKLNLDGMTLLVEGKQW